MVLAFRILGPVELAVDGEPQSLPATRPVPVYEVQVEGDELMVKLQ